MRKLYSLILLLVVLRSDAQQFPTKLVDSLTSIALSQKTEYTLKLNRDSALKDLWKATIPAARIDKFYRIVAYSDQLTPKESSYYHQLILKGARERGDRVLEAVVLAEIGFINAIDGNVVEGLKTIYDALKKAELTRNAQAIGIAYNNLGNCYPNNFQVSKDYFTKALYYSLEGKDYLFAAFDLSNIGELYKGKGQKDSALYYHLESYKLAIEKKLEPAITGTLMSVAEFSNNNKQIHYFRLASEMAFAKRNIDMMSKINLEIANFYLSNNQIDSAYFFIKKLKAYSIWANRSFKLSVLGFMKNYFQRISNKDSVLYYTENYYKLRDSLYGNKVVEGAQVMAFNDMQRQKELDAQKTQYQNKLILYVISVIAIAITVLAIIFWRSKKNVELAKEQVELSLDKLKSTQTQLIHAEKMASLGELTAGIAHEIQNPLNFVNNFSELNLELIKELGESSNQLGIEHKAFTDLLNDVASNSAKINHHGKRAEAIVKGMLQHSRSSKGQKESIDINALCDEYLKLAYHGLRAKDTSFKAEFVTDFDNNMGKVNILAQEMGRVILNLINNAFYAVNTNKADQDYRPTVIVSTKKLGSSIEIRIKDNGIGIPPAIKDKIFQPFFTTKPTGQGTGLGLSLAYDIITKAHGGRLWVESELEKGSIFIIEIPV